MLGDVNIFLTDPNDQTLAELEIMIAGGLSNPGVSQFSPYLLKITGQVLLCSNVFNSKCFFFFFCDIFFQSLAAEEKASGKR